MTQLPQTRETKSTPIEKVLCTAKADTTGGRDDDASRSSDGRLEVKFSIPGASGTGASPEQWIAVGRSACFAPAIKTVAPKDQEIGREREKRKCACEEIHTNREEDAA
jgi:organic hydroperoxide reductase OsmC/OhrA